MITGSLRRRSKNNSSGKKNGKNGKTNGRLNGRKTLISPKKKKNGKVITRPGKKERKRKKLPGVTGVASIRKYNMASKTDKKLMEWLMELARKHPHQVYVLFTRDINFMRDAQVTRKELPWNVHVLVLQEYVPQLQEKGVEICAREIGTMKHADNLRYVMRQVYLIWFHKN